MLYDDYANPREPVTTGLPVRIHYSLNGLMQANRRRSLARVHRNVRTLGHEPRLASFFLPYFSNMYTYIYIYSLSEVKRTWRATRWTGARGKKRFPF